MGRRILITGGYGFIGANLIRMWRLEHPEDELLNLDFMTDGCNADYHVPGVEHAMVDLRDPAEIATMFRVFAPEGIVNLAAETVYQPQFFPTNTLGTFNLVAAAADYWKTHGRGRFLHVSTSEVFGDVRQGVTTDERSPILPNWPYSISKAAGDLIVSGYHRSVALDTVLAYGTNVFGPRQPEDQLVPRTLRACLAGKSVNLFAGDRLLDDWLYVDDFCWGIMQSFELGRAGESYCFSGDRARREIDVVRAVEASFQRATGEAGCIICPKTPEGHESFAAVSHEKALDEWGWYPEIPFEIAIDETVQWYLDECF